MRRTELSLGRTHTMGICHARTPSTWPHGSHLPPQPVTSSVKRPPTLPSPEPPSPHSCPPHPKPHPPPPPPTPTSPIFVHLTHLPAKSVTSSVKRPLRSTGQGRPSPLPITLCARHTLGGRGRAGGRCSVRRSVSCRESRDSALSWGS